ncbi:MAG: sigma-70 family RNA polymerase sigma factor [Planctomycetes bacterium]|nr:sigma-70 family RNA polymerase sigma factor [Planctomycetota bacterium]
MTEPKTDGDIIRACQQGNQVAYAELVSRYQDRAFWVAYNMLGDAEEARDAAQEAFVRIYRAIDRFDFNMNFYTWLFRIVTNLSIDRLRKLKKHRAVALNGLEEVLKDPSKQNKPSFNMEEDELKTTVRSVLKKLPEKYKTILVLRDIEGRSCKEISSITGTSHATVRWRLHTARKLFKESWEREENARTG